MADLVERVALLRGRDFLTLRDFTGEEIRTLLELSSVLKARKKAGKKGYSLDGKNIALLFEKRSTRTRAAFTVASIDEGGHPEFLGKEDIQMGSKESIRDTARVLSRMFDCIEYRGYAQSVIEELAEFSSVPVINGLTDQFHPTQILADFLTILEHFGSLEGRTMAFIGDARNNMANSLMIGCAKVGMNLRLIAPDTLFPSTDLLEECRSEARRNGADIMLCSNPEHVRGADIIYTDVWCSMGEEAVMEERIAALRPYQVNSKLMQSTENPSAVFLHCLPAVRGMEVTDEVIEAPYSLVFEEAENRLHTIKAVLVATTGRYEEV